MKKVNNHIDFIEFPAHSTKNIASVKEFFTDVFDWSFQDWGDDYVDTKDSGLSSGFNADPTHRPHAPLAVIYVTDIEESLKKVTDAGGIITKDIFSFPGGKRFHFKDPAGNELAVWSE